MNSVLHQRILYVFQSRNLRFREGRGKKGNQVFAIKNLYFQKTLNYRQFANKKRLDAKTSRRSFY